MTENSTFDDKEPMTILESILFVASGPVPFSQLAMVTEMKPSEVKELVRKLAGYLEAENRGIRILVHDDKVQLTTAPETADFVEKFLGIESAQKLTRAAQETLTIIAYKQPTTRPEIDSIRGVNSDGVVKSLLSKGLIEELGRSEAPGRPILYGVTPDFMQHFGLESMDQLPEIDFEALFSTQKDAEGGDGRLLKD